MSRPSRHAWTLVEILIAASLMTVVLSGGFLLFNFGDKSRGVTATARALQSAMMIEENLTNDLARLYANGTPFIHDDARKNMLRFYVIDPAHTPADGTVGLRAVTYVLDPPKSLLRRQYAGASETIGTSPLESVEFLPFRTVTGPMLRVNLVVGRTKDDPDGPPLVHTFLSRPALSSGEQGARLTMLSNFEPRPTQGSPLPAPSGAFPPPPGH